MMIYPFPYSRYEYSSWHIGLLAKEDKAATTAANVTTIKNYKSSNEGQFW
jgi:hypothetical protein